MRTLFVPLFVLLFSCNSQKKFEQKYIKVAELIQENKIVEAKGIFNTIKYSKEYDFNYKLLALTIEFKSQEFTKALTYSHEFISKNPKNSFGYYYAGLCEYNLENYVSAEKLFNQAKDILNQSNKGFIYQNKSELFFFDQNSIYDDLIFMLGLSSNSIGKYRTSITYAETCINRLYKVGESYLIMADSYLNLGDKINAKKFSIMALENGNKDAESFLKNL